MTVGTSLFYLRLAQVCQNYKEPMRELLPGRERGRPQSISNQTHAQLFCWTPQRSEIISTMGRPQPPLMSDRGLGSEGTSKPEPGSHTLPRTEPDKTVTVSEIWSLGDSSACRILLVTSSLTTSRTSSSFSAGKRSASWSRAWRAIVTTSGSGTSLRSISAFIKSRSVLVSHAGIKYPRSRVVTLCKVVQLFEATLLAKKEACALDWSRA